MWGFDTINLVDFEFSAAPGERPTPLCLVAHNLMTGREQHVWQDELAERRSPPYPIGPRDLFVSYYASAELGCHLVLQWPLPSSILDLFVEFRVLTNGRPGPCGDSLLGALAAFGLDAL